eukprot:GFYU01003502.1.p1 GENE.GFYU01003502.1~~GFYU01003502.1.p1  ORF type:complete len:234 (-),score=22.11 GFYU01003502.1:95-796(-)
MDLWYARHPDFRRWLVTHLEQQGGFEWTYSLPNGLFDVRKILLEEKPTQINVHTAYQLIIPKVDMGVMQAAMYQGGELVRLSWRLAAVAAGGAVCFTVSVMASVVVYMALVVSASKEMEEEHPVVFQKFQQISLPLIVLGYTSLLVGGWCFYVACGMYEDGVYPHGAEGTWWIGLWGVLVPFIAVITLIAMYAVWKAQRLAKTVLSGEKVDPTAGDDGNNESRTATVSPALPE